jgi:hypothetical protein
VWAATGPVAIEVFEVGDRVIAHDEKSGEMTLREVTRVYVRRLAPIVAVTVLAAGGQVETFPTTEEHPFLVDAEKTGGEPVWRRADQLQPGDLVRTLDRGTTRVESITYTGSATTVYNLEVEGLHNYHVGENGVVVHNGSCVPDWIKTYYTNPDKIMYHWDRHAKKYGKELDEYLNDARAFWAKFGGQADLWTKKATEAGPGLKYKDPVTGHGGIFTPEGKIVTFFYD